MRYGNGVLGLATVAAAFAILAFTAPPATPANGPNMILANVGPNSYTGLGSGSPASGGLTLSANELRCTHSWTGDAWTITATANGAAVTGDAYYWRPIPEQWRNKPLRVLETGPAALASELQVGAWSVHTGNRLDPPPGDDGTNGAMRARRKAALESGNVATWAIVILGECQREDLDGDGLVGASDLSLVLGSWGLTGWRPEDINGDKLVDAKDQALLLGAWTPPKPGAGD